ncbi:MULTISPECIES: hypothetical protein [unclassified Schlesneria]|uniref:hypothetical protein n=1 Tax=Schlesneria TaxID=656899 RepID=UPI002F1376AE
MVRRPFFAGQPSGPKRAYAALIEFVGSDSPQPEISPAENVAASSKTKNVVPSHPLRRRVRSHFPSLQIAPNGILSESHVGEPAAWLTKTGNQ